MPKTPKKQRRIQWYTLSFETLRGWAVVLIVTGLGVGGYFGFRFLERQYLEREVARVIAEAEEMLTTLRGEPGVAAYRGEYETARQKLNEAEEQADRGELDEALKSAERSRTLLASILGALRHSGVAGEARLIAVRGGVEYRRGERGKWQPARSRIVLNAGDYVKTSGKGSAEIMTVDGTIYTVRSDTVVVVGETRSIGGAARERSINLEFGWVDLSTSRSASRVTTPGAEARVREDSSALVTYDEQQQVSRFAAYSGEIEVTSKGGETRQVKALQQVVQRGQTLTRPKPLPSVPVLLSPSDNLEASTGADARLVLSWQPVKGARRYALQVARNRFFVDSIIDVEDRTKTKATLGLQGEGSFVWRVAAFGDEGVKGPWSDQRRFRVTAPKRSEDLPARARSGS
ncbi:MAG: FecR domain-containing protein [Thermoanaerobaculia bacterium]